MMINHRIKDRIGKPLRVVAAAVLIVWFAALVACWNSCATGACSKPVETAVASCHDTGSSSDSADSDDSQAGCFSRKPLGADRQIAGLMAPELAVAWVANEDAIAVIVADSRTTVDFRPSPQNEVVFTPELSLGPALRSLAPPVSTYS